MLGTKTTLRSFRYRVRPERSYGPPRPPKPPRSGYGGWRDDDDNDDDDMRANSQKKRFFTWKTWIKYVLVPTVVLFFLWWIFTFVLLELSVWVSENKIIIPSS